MRLLSFARLSLALLLTCFSISTFAWNALGHMVIADIAYLNLTPAAQKKVDNLVSMLNQEYPSMKMFLNIAYWPDSIRSQRIETFTHWHYIDNPLTFDNTPTTAAIVDTDNAVWAVNTIKMVVRNDSANQYDRARFLSFLTHIVGDLHQPLHTVSLVAANHPTGDRGGNDYHVKINGKKVALHKIWDSGLGIFEGESSTEHAMEISTTIRSAYPKTFFGARADDMNPTDWATEGMDNARKYAYSIKEDETVSDNYVTTGQKMAEQEAALAGYRLAAILNQLLV
jgi:hypothetical protein